METLLSVGAILGIIAFIAVCFYAVNMIRRVSDLMLDVSSAVDETKRLAAELNRSLPSTFASLQATTTQATTTLRNVDVQLEQLGEGLTQFTQVGKRINLLESRIHDKVEGPLLQAASVVSGVSKAINTFVGAMRQR